MDLLQQAIGSGDGHRGMAPISYPIGDCFRHQQAGARSRQREHLQWNCIFISVENYAGYKSRNEYSLRSTCEKRGQHSRMAEILLRDEYVLVKVVTQANICGRVATLCAQVVEGSLRFGSRHSITPCDTPPARHTKTSCVDPQETLAARRDTSMLWTRIFCRMRWMLACRARMLRIPARDIAGKRRIQKEKDPGKRRT